MSEWELAAAVLISALLPCVAVAALATAGDALASLELAGTLTSTALMALAEGFHRQPFIDLALVLALMSLIGALVFARLMEANL